LALQSIALNARWKIGVWPGRPALLIGHYDITPESSKNRGKTLANYSVLSIDLACPRQDRAGRRRHEKFTRLLCGKPVAMMQCTSYKEFAATMMQETLGRETGPGPTEQPPGKLSGKRTGSFRQSGERR
jgi:hypothetical protein